MLTRENLLLLAFEEDFRQEFLELNKYFEALDKLGGKNCKNCSKNRQRLILRDMANTIIQKKLNARYDKIYDIKVSQGGIYLKNQAPQSDHNSNYIKLPLTLDQFMSCLLFKEVRKLLHKNLEDKIGELLSAILTFGVYSKEAKLKAKPIYPLIFSESMFSDFSALIEKLGIMEKVRSNPNSLKAKILEFTHSLEDEINKFILGKNVISIQKDGSSALILYR